MNVTEDPGQNGLLDAVMLTEAGRLLFCIIVILMLDAGLFDVHGSEDVRVQETWSLFNGLYVKNGLFVPALTPLTFH